MISVAQSAAPVEHPAAPSAVSFAEAFRFWLKLGFISFGGPAGQIAIMHTELVERRHWISEKRFLHALNYCMLLPGPEAQQRALCEQVETQAQAVTGGTDGRISDALVPLVRCSRRGRSLRITRASRSMRRRDRALTAAAPA
jgi:hypothetical protein